MRKAAVTIEDYPTTFEELIDRFHREEDCVDYIRRIRWPNGFRCPRCQCSESWATARGLLHCRRCGHQTSVTAGTVFQDTRKPLRLWFHVMWWVMSQKTGASAQNLKDAMGFGSYKTAWAWLQKLRRVMIRPGRDRLLGTVEVDETYIGQEAGGTKGRRVVDRALVAVAVECGSGRLGRVRFRCVPDASEESLVPFVVDNTEPGSVVITDGWKSYSCLGQKGYHHQVRPIGNIEEAAAELLPHVHLVISILRRWLLGTHQGAVSREHLQYYLDEYAFRFNRRLSTYRGKLFYRLMQQAVSTETTPLHSLFANKRSHRKPTMEPQLE